MNSSLLQPSGCTSSSSSEVPVPKPRRRLSVGQVDETELPGNQDGMKGDEWVNLIECDLIIL